MPIFRRSVALFSLALLIVAGAPQSMAQAGREPYKIGVTWPLTGPFVQVGAEILTGVQIAVEEINRTGGVKGHPLQLVIEDSQASPQTGVAAFRKLVDVDHVQAVITIFTNVVTAQIPLAEQVHVPFLTTVEVPGIMKGRYTFNHATNVGFSVPVLQEYWRTKRVKRLYALLGDNSWGHSVSALLRSAADSIHADYGESFFSLTENDYRGLIARAKEYNADALVIGAQGSTPETNAYKQAKELGITTALYNVGNVFDQKSWRDAMGPYDEGIVMAGLKVDMTRAHDFVKAYKAKTGFIPGYAAGEMYDVVHMFAVAMAKSSYNADAIRDALETLKGVPSSMGGTITMGADHYTEIKSVGLYVVKAGQLQPMAAR